MVLARHGFDPCLVHYEMRGFDIIEGTVMAKVDARNCSELGTTAPKEGIILQTPLPESYRHVDHTRGVVVEVFCCEDFFDFFWMGWELRRKEADWP